MDIWMTPEEAMKELGLDQPQPAKTYDANWTKLKQERTPIYDMSRCVKTQTPTLLKHEKNYSFQYRRWDGAQWHTELREVDTKHKKQGLNETQKRLKENIDTIFVLGKYPHKPLWITPIEKKTNSFDPRYQLIRIDNVWYCVIDHNVYEQSNTREIQNRGYSEITFSTKKEPVFTLELTEALLDRLIK